MLSSCLIFSLSPTCPRSQSFLEAQPFKSHSGDVTDAPNIAVKSCMCIAEVRPGAPTVSLVTHGAVCGPFWRPCRWPRLPLSRIVKFFASGDAVLKRATGRAVAERAAFHTRSPSRSAYPAVSSTVSDFEYPRHHENDNLLRN